DEIEIRGRGHPACSEGIQLHFCFIHSAYRFRQAGDRPDLPVFRQKPVKQAAKIITRQHVQLAGTHPLFRPFRLHGNPLVKVQAHLEQGCGHAMGANAIVWKRKGFQQEIEDLNEKSRSPRAANMLFHKGIPSASDDFGDNPVHFALYGHVAPSKIRFLKTGFDRSRSPRPAISTTLPSAQQKSPPCTKRRPARRNDCRGYEECGKTVKFLYQYTILPFPRKAIPRLSTPPQPEGGPECRT